MNFGQLAKAALVAATSIAATQGTIVWAQSANAQLDSIRQQLRDPGAGFDPKNSDKTLQQTTPSSHQTRDAEEAANQAARLRGPIGGKATYGIYGLDHRANYNSPTISRIERRAADSTVVLVKSTDVRLASDGKIFDLPGGNIIDAITNTGLCAPDQAIALKKPPEPFYDEPNPGFCSGFRVGKNRILTAGHCIVTEDDCRNTSFVFNFNTGRPAPEKGLSASDLYRCKSILGGAKSSDAADWQLVEVDRDMTNGSDLPLRASTTTPKLEAGAQVAVIGYPLGLPVKIVNYATVRGFGTGFFVANLSTYHGNSGSAVFNSDELSAGNLLVEGILVRGENDFDITTPCFISKRCPTDGCRGEDVTLATEVVEPPQ